MTDEFIHEFVSFTFSPSNRQLMTTRTKIIRMKNGEKLNFSRICHKKSRKVIAREYLKMKERNSHIPRVGRTTFMRTIATLTTGQQEMKQCVYYCLGVLLFDNVHARTNCPESGSMCAGEEAASQ